MVDDIRLLLLFPVLKVMGSYGRTLLKKIQGLYFKEEHSGNEVKGGLEGVSLEGI